MLVKFGECACANSQFLVSMNLQVYIPELDRRMAEDGTVAALSTECVICGHHIYKCMVPSAGRNMNSRAGGEIFMTGA